MNKQELRDYIANLPSLPETAPNFTWLDRRITLRQCIMKDDLDNFLSWAVIQSTMNTDYKSQHKHIDQWENHTGLKVSALETICEFGGGYGAMLKCLRERGFNGLYYGYDFPEFIALQRYYTGEYFRVASSGLYDLFISICAISESGSMDRSLFFRGKVFKHSLIRYQHEWDGINNHNYFATFEGDKDRADENGHWYLLK